MFRALRVGVEGAVGSLLGVKYLIVRCVDDDLSDADIVGTRCYLLLVLGTIFKLIFLYSLARYLSLCFLLFSLLFF